METEDSRLKMVDRKPVLAIFYPLSTIFYLSFFTLWALILTFPLPFHLFSHVPRGSEEAATVPFFNLWTLQWNIDQQVQGYPRYWDALIFAPDQGTFAFSEPQPLSALLAAPLWLVFRSPALGYNTLVILFLTLNGWFACWLLRGWGVSPVPSLLAGLLMQSLPFVAQEMGVLQLIAIFGFLWSLLFLSRCLSSAPLPPCSPAPLLPSWRNSLCLSLGPPVTFFTCSYYGLFSLFFLPLAFLFQLRRAHLTLKTAAPLVAAGLLALALTLPFLWAQHRELEIYHFTRSTQTIEGNSANLSYYRGFLDNNLFYGRFLGLKSTQGQRLFPGLGLMVLAGVGLWGGKPKRVKLYLLLAAGLALLLSLGLRLNVAGLQPYQWIRETVPGFAHLRSPFRFAMLVQLHLALLAGFGLANLGKWFRWSPPLLLPGVAALAIFEMLALPLPLQPVPIQTEPAPWQAWLNDHAGSSTVVLLPFAPSSKVEDFEQTSRWMLANRFFRGAMLNGYSGFFPADHARIRDEMLKFPTPAALQLLRQKGIEYLVVYHHLPNTPLPQTLESYLTRRYWDEGAGVAVYALK